MTLIDAIASRSVGQVLAAWLGIVLVFGVAYWGVVALSERTLVEGGVPVQATWNGLLTTVYFSFVTATSVGYGDVTPVGFVRALAMLEAVLGLLIFGFVISKFLSRHQEELVEEIHRIAFEDRLDRVQTNLYIILSELQSIAQLCAASAALPLRCAARIESAARVFAGELGTIHDLLYRPQKNVEEPVLEAILSSLAAAFDEFSELVSGAAASVWRSAGLERSLASISGLASEICGDCVPREYTPGLKEIMDRIQAVGRKLRS